MSVTGTASPSGRRSAGLLLVLLYIVVGPPAGAFALFVTVGIFARPPGGVWGWITVLHLMVRFSYIFGGPPALLCGLVAGWRTWRGTPISTQAIAAVGAVASIFVAMLWNGFEGILRPDNGSVLPGALMFGLIGAVAAVICRRLGRRLHEPAV